MKVLFISRPTLFSASGGDTVQVEETAKALRRLNIEVDIKLADENIDYSNYQLIHFFNVIRPNSIIPHVKKSALPFVISTIFVDYSEIEKKERGLIFKLLSRTFGSDGTDYIKTIGRAVLNGESIIDYQYLFKGHKRSVEYILNHAAMLLPNSHNEFHRLKKRYAFENSYVKVPNAISEDFIEQRDDSIPKKGVVCIGRIEFIKNQLNLIRAVKDTDIELSIIGKAAPNHQDYYERCKSEAGPNVQFLGQLSKNEVISKLNAAKVHVLPSWFETTGLSTIEAASLGCNIVISKKGDTEEYFKDFAHYCKPDQPASIKAAILLALSEDYNPKLRTFIDQHYTWEKTAKITLESYQKVLNS